MVKNESAQRSTSYSDSSHVGTTVTWRSIFIAFLLIPPNVFWVVETECIWHSGHPTTISLFWNVVLNLFFLILINLGIKRVSPKSALSQAEFITIYVMLSIASGLAGHDTLALMPKYLSEILPVVVLLIVVAGMLAAFMSTHDSYLLCLEGILEPCLASRRHTEMLILLLFVGF